MSSNRSSILAAVRSATTGSTATWEFTRCNRRAAATALGRASAASASSKQELSLQVGPVDEIPVNDPQPAHSGARHDLCLHCPQSAAPYNGHPRGANLGLAFFTQGGKSDLARVTGIGGEHQTGGAPWAHTDGNSRNNLPSRRARRNSRGLSKGALSLRHVRPPVLLFLPLLLGSVAAPAQNAAIPASPAPSSRHGRPHHWADRL